MHSISEDDLSNRLVCDNPWWDFYYDIETKLLWYRNKILNLPKRYLFPAFFRQIQELEGGDGLDTCLNNDFINVYGAELDHLVHVHRNEKLFKGAVFVPAGSDGNYDDDDEVSRNEYPRSADGTRTRKEC